MPSRGLLFTVGAKQNEQKINIKVFEICLREIEEEGQICKLEGTGSVHIMGGIWRAGPWRIGWREERRKASQEQKQCDEQWGGINVRLA